MKLTRQNLGNIAIAAVAVILFAGFVLLATKGGNKDNDRLSAVAPTSTTLRPTTTTTEPEDTTTSVLETTTTTTPPASATTVTTRATTATTKKPAAATTTTSKSQCASGQTIEASDTKNTFSYDQSGWTSGSSAAQPGSSNFPLEFSIKTSAGTNSTVLFEVQLTNNTGCTASFGNNLAVVVTLHPTSGGDDVQFSIGPDDAHKVTDIKSHETITLKQERALSGSGTFDATGTVQINYG